MNAMDKANVMVLCTPHFSYSEVETIEKIASEEKMTFENFVRSAVKNFCLCVPTQNEHSIEQ